MIRQLIIRAALFALRKTANLHRSTELADVLAYLERRQRRAITVAASEFDQDGRAAVIARELSVTIDGLRNGLHHGEAELAAQWGGQ